MKGRENSGLLVVGEGRSEVVPFNCGILLVLEKVVLTRLDVMLGSCLGMRIFMMMK